MAHLQGYKNENVLWVMLGKVCSGQLVRAMKGEKDIVFIYIYIYIYIHTHYVVCACVRAHACSLV